jgi:alkylated DNA repair dioxygenase AlkB
MESIIQIDPTSQILYEPDYFVPSDDLVKHLENLPWKNVERKGKDGTTYIMNRQQQCMHDEHVKPGFLFQKGPDMPWSPEILELKEGIEKHLSNVTNKEIVFDYCLFNLYPDGNASIGWHKDDEAEEEGKNMVASITVGAERLFQLKPNGKNWKFKGKEYSFPMPNGTLIAMMGDVQKNWIHSVPKDKNCTGYRVNLTFRQS